MQIASPVFSMAYRDVYKTQCGALGVSSVNYLKELFGRPPSYTKTKKGGFHGE